MKLENLSDSRLKGLSIRNLKVIDSITIQFISGILPGIGLNRLDGARKKHGGTTPDFETTNFGSVTLFRKGYNLFNPDFCRPTMLFFMGLNFYVYTIKLATEKKFPEHGYVIPRLTVSDFQNGSKN